MEEPVSHVYTHSHTHTHACTHSKPLYTCPHKTTLDRHHPCTSPDKSTETHTVAVMEIQLFTASHNFVKLHMRTEQQASERAHTAGVCLDACCAPLQETELSVNVTDAEFLSSPCQFSRHDCCWYWMNLKLNGGYRAVNNHIGRGRPHWVEPQSHSLRSSRPCWCATCWMQTRVWRTEWVAQVWFIGNLSQLMIKLQQAVVSDDLDFTAFF